MAEIKPYIMIPDGKKDEEIYIIRIPKWLAKIMLLITKISWKMHEPEVR